MSAALLCSWVVVALVVSAGIAVAAAAAQRMAARAIPARVIWAAAMLAIGGVTATQPMRQVPAPVMVQRDVVSAVLVAGLPAADRPSPMVRAWIVLRRISSDMLYELSRAAGARGAALPRGGQVAVLAAWPVASVVLGLILLGSYRRLSVIRRQSVPREIDGITVYVSHDTGPAVIGALAPAIVVPAWLLDRQAEEQRMVVAHEAAHIAAGDPWLLLAGCVMAILLPWNPAAWYTLARLRLAIELDCDARVLSRGTTPRQYGQLLIELSAASPGPAIPLGAPAFSYRTSHLERRLRTMTTRPTRFLMARRSAAVLIGGAAVLTACGAELPTAADLQGMDVAKAEARIGSSVLLDSGKVVYVVNGTKVSATQARAIAADSISGITVRRGTLRGQEIRIETKSGAAKVVQGQSIAPRARVANATDGKTVVQGQDIALQPVTVKGILGTYDASASQYGAKKEAFDKAAAERPRGIEINPAAMPMFMLDGRQVLQTDVQKVPATSIESVEVVKGPAAVAKYGAAGANGVVVITTKK